MRLGSEFAAYEQGMGASRFERAYWKGQRTAADSTIRRQAVDDGITELTGDANDDEKET